LRSPDIKFLILVSGPGKDFFSTWEYQAMQQLRADGVSEKEARTAVSAMHHALTVMRAGGTYEEFTKASQPLLKYPVFGNQLGITGGTAETYAQGQAPQFMRIWTTSAETYLSELEVPLLAIFGDHDDKIDWRESVRVYREAYDRVGDRDLTIKVFKNASHDLFAVNTAKGPAHSPPAPQLVPGYLDTMVAWLRARKFAQP
jgi:pimeloyl-ACP methyl ester carboxylesterase